MTMRVLVIAASILLVALVPQARADLQFSAAITAINGSPLTTGTGTGSTQSTDTYGNVLTILPAYMATGNPLATPDVAFTASTAASNFHAGTDRLTSTITVVNSTTGHSVTLLENVTFTFANNVLLNGPAFISLAIAGSTASPYSPINLDGIVFTAAYVEQKAVTSNLNAQGDLIVSFKVVPEPSSLALSGIAAVFGLAVPGLRRCGRSTRAQP